MLWAWMCSRASVSLTSSLKSFALALLISPESLSMKKIAAEPGLYMTLDPPTVWVLPPSLVLRGNVG